MTEIIFDFEERVERSADKDYLLFEDQRITYQEFADRVWKTANGLLDAGIAPGDHVAVMMENSPEWLYISNALEEINATLVPINIELRGDELSYILSNSDSRAVFLDEATVDPYLDVESDMDLEVVWGTDRDGMHSLSELQSSDTSPPDVAEPDDLIPVINYTSGTTGRPKGVVRRVSGDSGGGGLIHLLKEECGWTEDDVFYTPWPLYHGNARGLSAGNSFSLGATLALDEGFTASGFWDRIEHYGATTFNTLGAVNKILLKQPKTEAEENNSVDVVLTAGMPEDAWEEFEERFGVTCKEFYAATDGPAMFINKKNKVGAMGEPVFCEAKIVDDDGTELGPNEVGELWGRSLSGERTFEYYKRPDATEEAHEGAWYKTGDLVYKDEDDYYYFVDRKKYSIRRKGENISTYEVERAIEKHPAVEEACVYGIPSDLGEDEVATKVIPKDGESVEPEAIAEAVEGEIAEFEIPKYIEVTDSIPKTPTDRYQKMKLSDEGVTDSMWRNPEVV